MCCHAVIILFKSSDQTARCYVWIVYAPFEKIPLSLCILVLPELILKWLWKFNAKFLNALHEALCVALDGPFLKYKHSFI